MAQQTLAQQADAAVAAYDALVFASVGRSLDEQRATVLAFYAVEACEAAARDRAEPQWLRDQYRNTARDMRVWVQ